MSGSRRRLSDRIRQRQDDGEWAAFTATPPSGRPCERCWEVTDQHLVDAPEGQVWACRRCGDTTGADYAFDPRRPPAGPAEVGAAVDCLVQHVMAMRSVGRGLLVPIVAEFFQAGWCVRDVVHALNCRPDGELHETGSATWSLTELPDRTAWRIRERLNVWRLSAVDGPGEIMRGEWTATKLAMAGTYRAQADRQRERDDDWHQRQAAARAATGAGLVSARQAAAAATASGRRRKANAVSNGDQ